MVVKTDSCFFTDSKIWPGHGRRLVRKDGKLLPFISRKARSLYLQKKKALRLCWTQQWRARHKKGRAETVAKKKAKRVAKTYKAIAGLDLEALKKKRAVTEENRKAEREAALRAIKEKQRKEKEEAKKKPKAAAGKGAAPKPPGPSVYVKVPKQRRALGKAAVRK